MKKVYTPLWIVLIGIIVISCQERIGLPPVEASFSVTNRTIEGGFADITINLNRVAEKNETVLISLSMAGIVYSSDFTTVPAPEGESIKVVINKGSISTSVKVWIRSDRKFSGAEYMEMTLVPTDNLFISPNRNRCKITFGSDFVSDGDVMIIDGKRDPSEKDVKPVYIDLSRNAQDRMVNKIYTLAFYCGSGQYNVALNYTDNVRATFAGESYETASRDIAMVSLKDAERSINIGASPMTEEGLSINAIDKSDGSLSGTVFAEVSEKDSDNRVYFVAIGAVSKERWYKVKVNRKDNGYRVYYALINETEIKTVDVDKLPEYNFIGLDLSTGKVVIGEPLSSKWDILYSSGFNIASMGMGGGDVSPAPYFMNDMIYINNIAGVEVSEVKTESIPFENFAQSDIKGLKFSNSRNVIGSNWRFGGGPNKSPAVKYDRYYIVRDVMGTHYKLRFLKIGPDDGTVRGKPEIEYKIVK